MRAIGWLLLVLLAVGWLAAEVPQPGAAQWAPDEDTWRRTADGWQRATWLVEPMPDHRPLLHPMVVGLFELLVAAMALVAFSPVVREDKNSGESGRNSLHTNRLHHSAASSTA